MRIDPNTLDLKEKVVKIARVTKVVKGGRNFKFSALVSEQENPLKFRKPFEKASKMPKRTSLRFVWKERLSLTESTENLEPVAF